jgi:cAMP phosphodiesterase
MKIKVLGCSGGFGSGRRTTSLLINEHILLDAGTGVGDLSFPAMRRIDEVLLTHGHLDHVCGLALALDTLFERGDFPLRVHTTPETIAVLREHLFNWKLWPDFAALPNESEPRLHYAPILPGERRDFGAFVATPFEVNHTVPAVGYALQTERGAFAFTGDTYTDPRIWTFLNSLPRLTHLMIEVSFTDADAELGRISKHLTPSLLAHELRALRHRPEILLTHHKPGREQAIIEECERVLGGWRYHHLQRGDTIRL